MQRRGIVDLGSNTARLVDFAMEPGRWYRLVHQIRQPVRLGEGLGRDGLITEAAMGRAQSALELFAHYAAATELGRLEVLATSALRDAANREAFLKRVANLDLDLELLSGEEEARLGVLAVANGFDFESAVVLDLGGGSAQLSVMEGRRFVSGRAYPLGAVRLSERFLLSDPPKRSQVVALEAAVESVLGGAMRSLREAGLPMVALGGTIRNLARAVQKTHRYPLQDRIHGYFLRREDLEDLVDRLLGLKARKRSRVPGIKSDRADVIVAGALVYRWLLRHLDLEGVWISGSGLREGALLRSFLPSPHLIDNLRSFGVRNLLQQYAQAKEHIQLTRELSAELFWGLQSLHGFSAREAELLDAAAVLQDIGLAVNYYRHDRHGAYLVASAPLLGFTHREQALLAQLVRFHLRGRPRLGAYQRICEPDDERLLLTLAACLRLADHLERPRAQRVTELEVRISDSEVVVRPVSSGDLSLEMWQIEQHMELFRTAFGRRLVVVPIRRERRDRGEVSLSQTATSL
jgi:exopolyphosphatase/guanosine-5'-triphosphate,3'-diphosphate pyrophosphatase